MQTLSNDWIIPLAASIGSALVAFVVAGLRTDMFSKAKVELAVALEQLRGLKWRKFAHFVIALLEKRGLNIDEEDRQPGEGGVDLMMRRGTARYIVQCKHGSAYHLNADGMQELVKLINVHGAAGAILVNAGTPDSSQHPAATRHGIEVLEGRDLWQQLEPRLPFDIVEHIHQETAQRMQRKRRSALAAGGLFALIGGVAGFLLSAPLREPEPPAITAPGPLVPAAPAAAPSVTADQPAATANGAPMAMPDPNLSEEDAEQHRQLAEKAVLALTGVKNASWSTRSTMVLVLPLPSEQTAGDGNGAPSTDADTDAGSTVEDPLAPLVRTICDELTRFEELRYTRLQISYANPRNDDEARVRWRQCR